MQGKFYENVFEMSKKWGNAEKEIGSLAFCNWHTHKLFVNIFFVAYYSSSVVNVTIFS